MFSPFRCQPSEFARTSSFVCAGLVELGSCARPPLCCASYCYTNLGLLLAWPVFVTLPVYLLVTRLSWMNGWLLALLGWALVCVVLHIIVIGIHTRWRNCPKPQVGFHIWVYVSGVMFPAFYQLGILGMSSGPLLQQFLVVSTATVGRGKFIVEGFGGSFD